VGVLVGVRVGVRVGVLVLAAVGVRVGVLLGVKVAVAVGASGDDTQKPGGGAFLRLKLPATFLVVVPPNSAQ